MARAYQDAHVIDNLTNNVNALKTATADLSKAKGHNEEQITQLSRQNAEQARKIEALETRAKANEHNTTARLLNAHAYHTSSLHAPLTPLHDLSTNSPIRSFPKHERDVRTMSGLQVTQLLRALGVDSLGRSGGERKAEVRAQVGLPRDPELKSTSPESKASGRTPSQGSKTDAAAGKSEVNGQVGKKPLPKIAPGSTAEVKGKVGTGSAKGVGKPVAKEDKNT